MWIRLRAGGGGWMSRGFGLIWISHSVSRNEMRAIINKMIKVRVEGKVTPLICLTHLAKVAEMQFFHCGQVRTGRRELGFIQLSNQDRQWLYHLKQLGCNDFSKSVYCLKKYLFVNFPSYPTTLIIFSIIYIITPATSTPRL